MGGVTPKTLLLVDDDEDFLVGLATWLSEFGFRVLTATDSEEGLKLARQERPDLMVLDVNMGRGSDDGYSLCAWLKQDDETFDTPVIFLSGRSNAGDMLHGYYAGAHEYLTEPLDHDQLVRHLAKLLGT